MRIMWSNDHQMKVVPLEDFEAWKKLWMPIEDAPRDGTRILVDFGSRVGVLAVEWIEAENGNGPVWCVDDCKFGPYAVRGYVEADIRGWRPIPERLARSASPVAPRP